MTHSRLHKQHRILRVGGGPIQLIYGSPSQLAVELIHDSSTFAIIFRAFLSCTCNLRNTLRALWKQISEMFTPMVYTSVYQSYFAPHAFLLHKQAFSQHNNGISANGRVQHVPLRTAMAPRGRVLQCLRLRTISFQVYSVSRWTHCT